MCDGAVIMQPHFWRYKMKKNLKKFAEISKNVHSFYD